jgi:crossover junction endodeoxyribonuclease RuvC
MQRKPDNKSIIILGIDPGFGRCGYAVLSHDGEKQQVLDYGCVETPATMLFAKRLCAIAERLEALFALHEPDMVAVERLFFNTNQKTALRVAEVRGVVLYLAGRKGIMVREYTPLELKMALTGYGKAPKAQVQEMVKVLLKLPAVLRPDDVADAVAVALTCAVSSRMQGLT